MTSSSIAIFDPNDRMSGNALEVDVELTFQAWDYKKTVTQTTAGNVGGRDLIESAISAFYDSLEYSEKLGARIELVNEAGEVLECQDDEDFGEDWLADMLVSATIKAGRQTTVAKLLDRNNDSEAAE